MDDRLIALVVSPFVGSFLGVLVDRLPAGRPVALARSQCNSCGHKLGVPDLIPVVSYLAMRGRCRHCGGLIGSSHLVIELAAVAVALWAAAVDSGFRLWADCILGWALLALAWIDADHMVLPDLLTLPLLLAGLGTGFVEEPERIGDHAIGAAIGWLLLFALARAYRAFRGREGLGEGDAKLLAAAGAWITWSGLGAVMLLAGAIGLGFALAIRLRGGGFTSTTALPFGPPLALATWLVWILRLQTE